MTTKLRIKKNPRKVYRVARGLKAPNPHSESYTVLEHGRARTINYGWLTDLNYGRRLTTHIKAENNYATASFKKFEINKVAKTIAKELYGYLETEDHSIVTVDGAWSYYTISNENTIAASHWRFPTKSDKSQSQLIFDEAQEKKKLGWDIVLGNIQISDDNKLALITYCSDESEKYILQVRNIEDGRVICECDGVSIDEDGGSLAYFNSSNDGVVFIRRDGNEKDAYLCYREFNLTRKNGWVGREIKLYCEHEEGVSIAQTISRDHSWLLLVLNSGNKTEVLIFDRNDLRKSPVKFGKNNMKFIYNIDMLGDRVFILSDLQQLSGGKIGGGGEMGFFTLDASNGITKENVALRSPSSWVRTIEFPKNTIIESYLLFNSFTVFGCRVNGISRVLVAPRDTEGIHGDLLSIGSPGDMIAQTIYWAPENIESNSFMIAERGMCPGSIYQIEIKSFTKEEGLVYDYKVVDTDKLEGMDSTKYVGKIIQAEASDGVLIPIALWTPIHTPVIGTVLNVYGAYGEAHEIGHDEVARNLLDHGVAVATAYVRGGGELGQGWHRAGKSRNKTTTITDTIAVAQKLNSMGLAGVNGNNIVLRGESAGGIAIGGAVNLKPEAFAGVIASSPFVDCLTTMLDPTSPLTVTDYPEWGNPSKHKADWDSLYSWSPVDNVREDASNYPPILATAGLRDARVGVWEPARWVLTLRKAKATVYLRTNLDAGHVGETHQGESLKAQAEVIAFVLWCLNRNSKVEKLSEAKVNSEI